MRISDWSSDVCSSDLDRAEALAGHACLPQAELLAKQLGTQYGEHLVAAGVDANGGLLQVYSNAESGTWTIAVTMPAGPTCIMSAGEGWTHDKAAAMPKPGETP